MVKNLNWQEADQPAIYKRVRGATHGDTERSDSAVTARPRCLHWGIELQI